MAQQDLASTPLSELDANNRMNSGEQNPFNPLSDKNSKPAPSFAQESQQHRSLHSRLVGQEKNGKQNGPYVSPSDNIMSPASAKLNAFKEKRFSKNVKPRTLFTRSSPMGSFNASDVQSSPVERQFKDIEDK